MRHVHELDKHQKTTGCTKVPWKELIRMVTLLFATLTHKGQLTLHWRMTQTQLHNRFAPKPGAAEIGGKVLSTGFTTTVQPNLSGFQIATGIKVPTKKKKPDAFSAINHAPGSRDFNNVLNFFNKQVSRV